MDIQNYNRWLPTLQEVAIRAGRAILDIRDAGLRTELKQDDSPVTQADKAADAIICELLRALTPDIHVVSEEGKQQESAVAAGTFWCVDPLDGTKGFIRGGDEFTVNIGLIKDLTPVLGVIFVPPAQQLYSGVVGGGATRRDIGGEERAIFVSDAAFGDYTGLTSRYHKNNERLQYLDALGIKHYNAASSSLKFCRIAEGEADVYPRFGPTMEWDTAAGHAILMAAGGDIIDMQTNKQLRYGKPDFYNGAFLAGTMNALASRPQA